MMPSVIRRSFAGSQGCCNRLYFHYAVLPTLCDETTDTQKWTNRQIRPSLSLKLCPASHSMMLFHADERPLKSHLRPLSVLVFHLLLTHSCRGQSQLIGSSQPIVATVGDDIILPCRLEPAEDVTDLTLEWTRPDLNPRFVYVWRSEQELVSKKHKSFEGRTSLFVDELKFGNVSLRLSKVKLSDRGTYRCFIPTLARHTVVQVVVGAASSPVITLAGIDRDKRGVVLQCESAGWHPEPEVLWLDGEGKLLSAGPTETVRGPDDLYTVSSRVTVEKRHSNSFTCRVQQRNINQTRETHIYISEDFFKAQSSSAAPVVIGLAVSLALCILLLFAVVLFVWKQRRNKIKTRRSHRDETDKGEKKNGSETHRTEDQFVTEEEMKALKGKDEEKSKHQLQEEQQRREEAEREVQTLKEELHTKKTEYESKLAEVQQQLQSLEEELETKTRELEENKAAQSVSWFNLTITTKQTLENEQQRREQAETKVQDLKQKLNDKIKELQEEQRRREEAENRVKTLEEELQTKEDEIQMLHVLHAEQQNTTLSGKLSLKLKKLKHKQHLQQQQSEEEAEKEAQTSKDSGVADETEDNQAEVQQLQNVNQRMENNQQTLNQKLENIQHSTAGDNNEDLPENNDQDHNLTSPANQDSAKSHITVDEVDVHGKHVRLSNNSKEDQPMGDWELHIRVNNRKPMEYHFKPSFILKAGNTVTIWAHGQGVWFEGSTDLVWSSQKAWGTGEQLLVTVYSNTGEVEANKMLELGSSQTYQEIICMTSQDSATGPITVDEVELKGEYVRLSNTSDKAQELKDWELHIQVNNRKPIVYKFSSSFILVAGNTVTIWSSDHPARNDPPTDLVWQNQKSWGTGEQLLVTVYNNTGEEMATTLKTPNISDG
ncbi:lamin-A-like isoform X1 [Epinephelus moara]|uniref:lamin-A-like isoform X1 n=1 Tax=Epinephelus moara TaxID=300413 RepID=UPI00214EF98B|nr:lamin-A-like isoform X1 [Epinephelus moara]